MDTLPVAVNLQHHQQQQQQHGDDVLALKTDHQVSQLLPAQRVNAVEQAR